MYKNHEYFLSLYYRLSDFLALNLAFLIGFYIRFHNELLATYLEYKYTTLIIVVNLSWLGVTSLQKIYRLDNFTKRSRYFLALAIAILLQLLITIAFNGLTKALYSRLFLIYFYTALVVVLSLGRLLTLKLYEKYLKKKFKESVVVLFGEDAKLNEVMQFFRKNLSLKKQKIEKLRDKKTLIDQLNEIIKKQDISELYLPLSNFNEEEIELVSNFCDNHFIRLRLIFDWKGIGARKLVATKLDQTSIFKVALTPLDDPFNALVKRAFDIFLSLMVLLFVFSWFLPIVAIAIKISSKGPILFIQQRSGMNNAAFNCYKFRSMKQNLDADIRQATQNDPRITKIGKFLRNTSLDELPQFINVLKGEMSVVGPRPHMIKHTEEYSQLVGNFMNRHAVRPGITGLAQVKGYRGEIDDFSLLQNRIRLDRFYVNNWSLYFDVRILFQTVSAIFEQHR